MSIPYLEFGYLTEDLLDKVPVGDYFIYDHDGYRIGLKVTPRYMIPMPGSAYKTIEQARAAAEQYCKRIEFPTRTGEPLHAPIPPMDERIVCAEDIIEKNDQIYTGTAPKLPMDQEQADLLARLEQANADLEKAKDRVRKAIKDRPDLQSTVVTCVYCGQEYPDGTPTAKAQILTDHIKVCTKHPMRQAEAKIEELKAACRAALPCIEELIKFKGDADNYVYTAEKQVRNILNNALAVTYSGADKQEDK